MGAYRAVRLIGEQEEELAAPRALDLFRNDDDSDLEDLGAE